MPINRIPANGLEQANRLNLSNATSPTTPPLNFFNDLGTGIFSPELGVTAVASNGVEILRFTPDGIETANGIYGAQNPNFTENVILYVNKGDLNATDVDTNSGGNLNTPFYSIERALLEVAIRSLVAGSNNDRTGYTIVVYPGEYVVDNRPGLRGATNISGITDITTELYKFNPANVGGVIVPRNASIIAIDPHKTIIRPKWVPNPTVGVSGVMWDGANMIKRNQGYIVEQTWLKIKQDYPAITNINEKCRRDIVLLINSIVNDLENGGNEHVYIAGEMYVLNNINVNISGSELPAVILAINTINTLCNYTVTNNWISYSEILVGKTIDRYVPTVVVDYASNGDCASVVSAINGLCGVLSGIISNPSSYQTTFTKSVGVYKQTPIFKITAGVYIANLTFADAMVTPYNSVSYTGNIPAFTLAANATYSHHKIGAVGLVNQRNNFGELTDYYQKINTYAGGVRELLSSEYFIQQLINVVSVHPYIYGCFVTSMYGLCGVLVDGNNFPESSEKIVKLNNALFSSLQLDSSAYVVDVGDSITGTNYKYKHYGCLVSNKALVEVNDCTMIGQAEKYAAKSGGILYGDNCVSKYGGKSLVAEGNSNVALLKNSDYNILRIVAPAPLTLTRILVGSLTTSLLTATSVSGTFNAGINLLPDTYIYVDVPNPTSPLLGNIQLRAKIVSAVLNPITVTNGVTISDENSIYNYLQCIGNHRFESTWYDPMSSLTLGQQEDAEKVRRQGQLPNFDTYVYIQRYINDRDISEQNHSVLIAVPSNIELPRDGDVIRQSLVDANGGNDKYYLTNIQVVPSTLLDNDFNSQGTIVRATILQANTINIDGGLYPNHPNDLNPSDTYLTLLNTIEPSSYTGVTYVDVNSAAYISLYNFLLDFGVDVTDVGSLLNVGVLDQNYINRFKAIPSTPNVNTTITGNSIKFSILKPSRIDVNNHTWYYNGYKNYTTGLVANQTAVMSEAKKLTYLATSYNGGMINVSGRNEYSIIYQGNNSINLIDNTTNCVRYDGVVVKFNNIPEKNIDVNTLKVKNLVFDSTAKFETSYGVGVSDLTTGIIPTGIQAGIDKYGLVRRATQTELTNKHGDGYITPEDTGIFAGYDQAAGAISSALQIVSGGARFYKNEFLGDSYQSIDNYSIQSGTLMLGSSLSSGGTITFPNPFPVGVTPDVIPFPSNNGSGTLRIVSISNTGWVWESLDPGGLGGSITWIAVG